MADDSLVAAAGANSTPIPFEAGPDAVIADLAEKLANARERLRSQGDMGTVRICSADIERIARRVVELLEGRQP